MGLDAVPPTRFDLIFECSGSPSALNNALGWLRHSGRVVVGSWYGDKMVTLNLGEAFHRERLRIISSQSEYACARVKRTLGQSTTNERGVGGVAVGKALPLDHPPLPPSRCANRLSPVRHRPTRCVGSGV
ncbi:MAG UNVERIFIED_CONTAM: hypothetical protein LVT10_00450 [Anaerolineae bacterium]